MEKGAWTGLMANAVSQRVERQWWKFTTITINIVVVVPITLKISIIFIIIIIIIFVITCLSFPSSTWSLSSALFHRDYDDPLPSTTSLFIGPVLWSVHWFRGIPISSQFPAIPARSQRKMHPILAYGRFIALSHYLYSIVIIIKLSLQKRPA